MKTTLVSTVVLVFASTIALGQTLLDDSFGGSSVDTSFWTVSEPFSDSSATVSGGSLSLANGAGVLTTDSFPTPVEVAFSFALPEQRTTVSAFILVRAGFFPTAMPRRASAFRSEFRKIQGIWTETSRLRTTEQS